MSPKSNRAHRSRSPHRAVVTYIVTPQEGQPFNVVVPVEGTVCHFRIAVRLAQTRSMGQPGVPLGAQILKVTYTGEELGREQGDLLAYYGLGPDANTALTLTWDEAGLET
jgi:hypothetical protein